VRGRRHRGVVEDIDDDMDRPTSSWLDTERTRAAVCGTTVEALRQLRCLIEERGRCAWRIGDALVAIYGSPPPAGVMDGSHGRLAALAIELGVSRSWLTQLRIAAASWPARERKPTVAFQVHHWLSATRDRFVRLDQFVVACAEAKATPSLERLRAWLDGVDEQDDDFDLDGNDELPGVDGFVPAEPRPALPSAGRRRSRPGRPRIPAVERVCREAIRLDRGDLERLIARLQDVLAGGAATAAA
jgi:hypothetical protein